MLQNRMTNYGLLEHLSEASMFSRLFKHYREPDLSWVSLMMKRIYDNKENIDEIAAEYNVVFNDGGESNHFVKSAEYSDGQYKIWLSNKSINSILRGQSRTLIEEEIEETLAHEDTHNQQNQLKALEQTYYVPSNNSEKEYIQYISQYSEIDALQYSEIDAFAREVAKQMIDRGYGSKDVDNLQNLNLSKKAMRIIYLFTNKTDEDVKNKFLKEIFNWFEDEPNKSSDPLAYKQWLKDHI